ncbi:MAG: hypothetical protein ABII26_03400 [Pseudomonadota bacterium]
MSFGDDLVEVPSLSISKGSEAEDINDKEIRSEKTTLLSPFGHGSPPLFLLINIDFYL